MSAASSSNALNSQTLSQADFLKLLVTQMSSQDPLNPQSDTAFAAQLAQFSSLQATQTMGGNLQTMQATGLLGQTVYVTPSTGGSLISGVVSAVQIASGTPEIIVNGQAYTISQLAGIVPTSATTNPTNPTNPTIPTNPTNPTPPSSTSPPNVPTHPSPTQN